jgi:DNA polymerase-3 subunit epsilon
MKKDFFALDVETATSNRNSICDIGIVVVRDLEIKKKVRYLIKPPENKYDILNTQIHGIDSNRTKYSETFDVLWGKIEKAILSNLIVAHNAQFDIDCIHKSLEFYNMAIPNINYECTYQLTGYRLDIVTAAYKIECNHHNALSDAEACAKIYINLFKGIQPDYEIVSPNLFEKKSIFTSFENKTLSKQDLQPDFEHADKNSPFYMKKIVFTGDLDELERSEAAHIAKELGADVNTSISRKTNYVIIGSNPGPSKLMKIKEIQEKGFALKILNEAQYLAIIKEFHI